MSDAGARLRLGVIGCGRVFERFHLPALQRVSEVELVSAAEPDAARLGWLRDRAPGVARFASLGELARGPELDAALILTPPVTHAELAVSALEAGLHVLVEKPMALRAIDARTVAQVARRTGKRLHVGFNRRFRDPYRRLRERLGTVPREEIRVARSKLAVPASAWRAYTAFLGREDLGGGVLDDVLSHQADLLVWLLGGPPETACARIDRPGTPAEILMGQLRFSDGRRAECIASHGPYAETLEVELAGDRVLLAGSSYCWAGPGRSRPGAMRSMLRDRGTFVLARLLGRPSLTLASFEGQLRDFARAVRGGSVVEGADAEAGARTVEIVEACRESAQSGGDWRAVR